MFEDGLQGICAAPGFVNTKSDRNVCVKTEAVCELFSFTYLLILLLSSRIMHRDVDSVVTLMFLVVLEQDVV